LRPLQYQHWEARKPDTGVVIDPRFQRGGFARESRVAINYFAVQAGAKELFCDVRTDNTPSINNVLKMGYQQLFPNGMPVKVENQGVMGPENCYRYRITRYEIRDVLPRLLQELAERYWRDSATEITWAAPDMIDEMIRISYDLELRHRSRQVVADPRIGHNSQKVVSRIVLGRDFRRWGSSHGWLAK
jgi:hypothetical protein